MPFGDALGVACRRQSCNGDAKPLLTGETIRQVALRVNSLETEEELRARRRSVNSVRPYGRGSWLEGTVGPTGIDVYHASLSIDT
jgi:hypothetical protein